MDNYKFNQQIRETAKALIEAVYAARDHFPTKGKSSEAIKFYDFIIKELDTLHNNRCEGRTAHLAGAMNDLYKSENLSEEQVAAYKHQIYQDLYVIEGLFNKQTLPVKR